MVMPAKRHLRRLEYTVDGDGSNATPAASAGGGPLVIPPDPDPLVLVKPAEDDLDDLVFWESRKHLTHIRGFAYARSMAPWAVLLCSMARVAAAVEPNVVLPALIADYASLNTFVIISGPSGAGKGGSMSASKAGYVIHDPALQIPPGSGEGIAKTYMQRTPKRKDGSGGELEQVESRALFYSSEIDSLTALATRSASTLLSEMCKAWSGEQLGFGYADASKRIIVPEHRYRLCFVLAVQPRRAQGLFDAADAGVPQRFLWASSQDPTIGQAVAADPGPLEWAVPVDALSAHLEVFKVCDLARKEIISAHIARQQGDANALDGHVMLCQLKAAAVLALMDGRLSVEDEDWQLAAHITAHSAAVRKAVQAELAKASTQAQRERGKAEAMRAAAGEQYRADTERKRLQRVALNLLGHITTEWISDRPLKNKIAARDRALFEKAMELLVERGSVVREMVPGTGQSGYRTRRKR